jgi:shikimate kinase
MNGHLWLIGMMGAGKSSAARRLAKRLDRSYVDLDDEITARMGCSVAQLWGERGEAAFRQMEAAAVIRAAAGPAAVIATGGGVVLDPANIASILGPGGVVDRSG